MNQLNLTSKNDYAHTVCRFLAEGLRAKSLELTQAKAIARRVVQNLNLIDTQQQFLDFVREMRKDFPEVAGLESQTAKYVKADQRIAKESLVQKFAMQIMDSDTETAIQILADAAQDQMDLPALQAKYPKFSEYLQSHHARQ